MKLIPYIRECLLDSEDEWNRLREACNEGLVVMLEVWEELYGEEIRYFKDQEESDRADAEYQQFLDDSCLYEPDDYHDYYTIDWE